MQKARMIGNNVQNLIKAKSISLDDLCKGLGCTKEQVQSFFSGRMFVSYEQMKTIAELLKVSVSSLLAGDASSYNETVVHCMNDFQNTDNREFILDIIDDYLDVVDSVRQ